MKFLADFFPILLFFIAYKLYGIYVATGVAIAASLVQVGYTWVHQRRLENMHLVTLGLLIVFGGLTILLRDQTFIMWKPSILNWLFALVFLGSQFIGQRPLIQRLMSHAITVPDMIWRRLNGFWIVFFLFLGAANLYVASDFFHVDQALRAATGLDSIDLTDCQSKFSGGNLALCQTARELEETWVNFKLFGMMGLTVIFVIGQAFYLAKHVQDEDPEEEQ